MVIHMLTEQAPYLALVALGLAVIAVIAGIWANVRYGKVVYEQSLALQRLRTDMLDIQTESSGWTKTAESLSQSLARVSSELNGLRSQMSQLTEGLADTKAVVQRFGREVNTALQSNEVRELLQGHTRLGDPE